MSLGTLNSGFAPASGGGASIPVWASIPAAAEGTRTNATLGGVAIVGRQGSDYIQPGYPTKAQLDSLWPASPQEDGVAVGPMPCYWDTVARQIPDRIYVIGDSNTVGQGATPSNAGCRDVSWPVVLANSLGWRDGCACSQNLVAADSRVTPSGWTSAVKEIPGACWVHDVSADDMVITLDVPFDRLLVTGVAIPGNPATTTILVDDVSVGTLNHDLGSASTYHPVVDVPVTRGLHTIKVRSGGSSGTCYVNTVETFDSLSTVPDFVHLGVADANIGDHISTAPYGAQARVKMFCGAGTTVCMNTINDLDDGIAVATIQAGFSTLKGMWTSRPGSQWCGIVGWATNRPGVTKTDLDLLAGTLYDLSESTLGAWIDTRASLGYTYATTDPADVSDDWHLTTQGYAKQAAIVGKAFA